MVVIRRCLKKETNKETILLVNTINSMLACTTKMPKQTKEILKKQKDHLKGE